MLSARGKVFGMLAGFLHAAAGLLLRGDRVDELLNALRHAAMLVTLQVVQLVCCCLGSTQVLHGRSIDRAVYPKHASDGSVALSDRAHAAGLASSRRVVDGAVDPALVGLGEASHGGQLLGSLDERDAAGL